MFNSIDGFLSDWKDWMVSSNWFWIQLYWGHELKSIKRWDGIGFTFIWIGGMDWKNLKVVRIDRIHSHWSHRLKIMFRSDLGWSCWLRVLEMIESLFRFNQIHSVRYRIHSYWTSKWLKDWEGLKNLSAWGTNQFVLKGLKQLKTCFRLARMNPVWFRNRLENNRKTSDWFEMYFNLKLLDWILFTLYTRLL